MNTTLPITEVKAIRDIYEVLKFCNVYLKTLYLGRFQLQIPS